MAKPIKNDSPRMPRTRPLRRSDLAALRHYLHLALEVLSQSDQNAILDWLEQRMRIEQQRQAPPVPRTERLTPEA